MGLSVIPTASAEQEPVSLPSVYGAQYVPDVFLRRPGEVDTSTGEKVELSESIEYRRVKIINIGQKPNSLKEIEGQYMGLMKFSNKGVTALKRILLKAKEQKLFHAFLDEVLLVFFYNNLLLVYNQ